MNGFRPFGEINENAEARGALTLATDAKGRLLLQLRDPFEHIFWPSHWSLFGGQVEDGEDIKEAAVREFREETGITIHADDLAPYACATSVSRNNALLYVFRLGHPIEPHQISLGEGAGFAFFEPNQVPALKQVPSVKPVIEHWLKEISA